MSRRIAPEVIDVIARSAVHGAELHLPDEQLDRKLYEAVNKVLVALGGKWNRAAKAHLFPNDVEAMVEALIVTGEYVDEKREFDAFYTPAALADRVINLADIDPGMRVLEPSAGAGALSSRARAAGGVVVECEIRPPIGVDFMSVSPAGFDPFDRVVMNPPFSRQQDMLHVTHALRFLRPGGMLVSIMSPAWQFRETITARVFRDLVAEMDGQVFEVEAGAFRESGTDVRSTIVCLDVPS